MYTLVLLVSLSKCERRMGYGVICNTVKVDLKLFCYYLPVGEKNVTHNPLVRKVKTIKNHIKRNLSFPPDSPNFAEC